MPYIQVLFNGEVKQVIELPEGPLTIGRSAENDLQIDNQGVSSLHAIVTPENGNYVIEDKDSKNGTFVNGNRIDRKELQFGDVISIFKHTLKYTAWVKDGEEFIKTKHDDASLSETVVVDQEHLNKIIQQQSKAGKINATVRFDDGVTQPLSQHSYSIGKDRACDFKTKGVLAPAISATLELKEDGFYLDPAKKGEAKINDHAITTPTRLNDGDHVAIRNIGFQYILNK